MKMHSKVRSLAVVVMLAASGFQAQAATTAPDPNDTPLNEGSNRVPVPDSGDVLVLKVRGGKIVGGSVIPKGSSTPVPFTPTKPIGANCPAETERQCVAWKAPPGANMPPQAEPNITCYCVGGPAPRIKGAPMTLVNNTN